MASKNHRRWRTGGQVALVALGTYVVGYFVIVHSFSYRKEWAPGGAGTGPAYPVMAFGHRDPCWIRGAASGSGLTYDPSFNLELPAAHWMEVLNAAYWPLLRADSAVTGLEVMEPLIRRR